MKKNIYKFKSGICLITTKDDVVVKVELAASKDCIENFYRQATE